MSDAYCASCARLKLALCERADEIGTLRGQLDYARVMCAAKDREIARLEAELARRGRVVEVDE